MPASRFALAAALAALAWPPVVWAQEFRGLAEDLLFSRGERVR